MLSFMRPSKNNSLCQTLSEETKLTSEALNLHEDLLLHEVEAHRYDAKAQEKVNSSQDQLRICFLIDIITSEFEINLTCFGIEN